jgi:cell wall-associated NlpC family hydrolase
MTPDAVIAEAKTLIDTPFRHQGREKGVGIDCLGVISISANTCGLKIKDRTDYSHQPSLLLQQALREQMIKVSKDELRVADVLLMKYEEPQHLALVTCVEPLTIIHAFAQAKKVLEQEVDPYMWKRVVSAYRFKEFADG